MLYIYNILYNILFYYQMGNKNDLCTFVKCFLTLVHWKFFWWCYYFPVLRNGAWQTIIWKQVPLFSSCFLHPSLILPLCFPCFGEATLSFVLVQSFYSPSAYLNSPLCALSYCFYLSFWFLYTLLCIAHPFFSSCTVVSFSPSSCCCNAAPAH